MRNWQRAARRSRENRGRSHPFRSRLIGARHDAAVPTSLFIFSLVLLRCRSGSCGSRRRCWGRYRPLDHDSRRLERLRLRRWWWCRCSLLEEARLGHRPQGRHSLDDTVAHQAGVGKAGLVLHGWFQPAIHERLLAFCSRALPVAASASVPFALSAAAAPTAPTPTRASTALPLNRINRAGWYLAWTGVSRARASRTW